MGSDRNARLLQSVGITIFASLLALIFVVVSLAPSDPKAAEDPIGTFSWLGVGIFIALFFDAMRIVILREAAMRPDVLAEVGRGATTRPIAVGLEWFSAGQTLLMLPVVAGICALFVFGVARERLQFGLPTALLLGGLAAYPLLRLLLTPVVRMLAHATRSWGATYQLRPGGFDLTLDKSQPFSARPRPIVSFRFDEIEQLVALSYAEAQAAYDNTFQPEYGFDFATRGTIELVEFERGKAPRPSLYCSGWPQSIGTNVVIRGPTLLYLVNFAPVCDVGALVTAYQYARASGFRAVPAPRMR